MTLAGNKLEIKPTVSVLMAVYNGEEYLRESLDSLLAQTFADFELIVVEDGSTDSTPEILDEYAARDPRVRVHRNPRNLKLIASLNKAFELARGEFLARQDADDLSLPRRLELQVAFLRAHPEVGVLGGDYERLHADGVRLLRRPPRDDTSIRWKLLFGNCWCHGTMMFRRDLFEEGEVCYGPYLHVEDYELWNRLLRRSRAATLPEPLAVYRVHEASICSQNSDFQDRSLDELSGVLINRLLAEDARGEDPLSAEQIRALRRGRSPRQQELSDAELREAGEIFRVFEAFARRRDVDAEQVRVLRRVWIRRLLSAIPLGRWGVLARGGFLRQALRHAPAETILAFASRLKNLRHSDGSTT